MRLFDLGYSLLTDYLIFLLGSLKGPPGFSTPRRFGRAPVHTRWESEAVAPQGSRRRNASPG